MTRPPTKSGAGRIAVYGAAGALVGAVPFPIVPRKILRAIRGAMAHDVCARHGVALTAEARDIFAEPIAATRTMLAARDAVAFAASRVAKRVLARFALIASIYSPMKKGWDTLAFGHLLDRYLTVHRHAGSSRRSLRIEAEEAEAIRSLLDRAAFRAIHPSLKGEGEAPLEAPEDHRSTIDRAVDVAIIGVAGLPEFIAHRLDKALDELATKPIAEEE